MKLIKVFGHPVFLMSLFLLLIIEGDHFGGLYLLYLLLALPHGAAYALVALAGLLLVFGGYKVHFNKVHFLKPGLYLTGLIIMLFSLFLFFSKGNKWETFKLTIPLLSFVIFGLSCLCFIINSLLMFMQKGRNRTPTLTMI